MPKEKVTLTLDSARLAELRRLIGRGSVSAAVDDALSAHLERLRHFAAVEEWLAETARSDGPIPDEVRAWAAEQFDAWDASAGSVPRRTG